MGYQSKLLKKGKYSSYLNGKFHEFQGYEACLEDLAHSMQEVLDYAERVEAENEELKDAHWKDKRIQFLEEKLDQYADYWRGFPITKEQIKAIDEWKDRHWTKQHNAPDILSRLNKQGAIGGAFSYHFVPTSIGTSGVCRCDSCYRRMLNELGSEKDYKDGYHAYLDLKKTLIEKYDCEYEFQEIG